MGKFDNYFHLPAIKAFRMMVEKNEFSAYILLKPLLNAHGADQSKTSTRLYRLVFHTYILRSLWCDLTFVQSGRFTDGVSGFTKT